MRPIALAVLALFADACHLPECSAVDAPDGASLEVTLENQRATTVYWAGRYGCFDAGMLELRDAAGAAVARGRRCDSTAINSCPAQEMVELAPGARHTVSMSLARYGEPRCSLDGVSCTSRLEVPAGGYTVEISWYETLYPGTGTGTGERHIASAPCQLPGQSHVLVPIQ